MTRAFRPLEITVYQDVFCAWCYVAEARLELLQRELGGAVRWSHRPYPLRLSDGLPSKKEVNEFVGDVRLARKESEGARLSPELWTGADPPRSSVPALAALEAARMQGPEARQLLMGAMRRAALEQGVNVSRPDVILELAGRLGLNMNRFVPAFQSPQTQKLVLEEHAFAARRGVKGVPTLVIGNRWMISGLRDVAEYRNLVMDCLRKHALDRAGPADPVVH